MSSDDITGLVLASLMIFAFIGMIVEVISITLKKRK